MVDGALNRFLVLTGCCLAASIIAFGCGGSGGTLAISCTDFLEKAENEQLDIATSFGSKSLYGDDDPATDAVIPGVQGYKDSLVEYCSDSDHSDESLSDLDAEAEFGP